MPTTYIRAGHNASPANKQKGTKVCNFCHEEKKITNFYISTNPIYSADKRVPICKDCIIKESLNEDGTIDEIKLNKVLKLIDRPYYKDTLDGAFNTFKKTHSYIDDDKVKYYGKEIIREYFKVIAMRQDKHKSYADSEREKFIHHTNTLPKSQKDAISKRYADIDHVLPDGTIDQNAGTEMNKRHFGSVDDFKVTDEVRELFGDGFSTMEYKKMADKYEKLKMNYTLQTNLHQEALATYVRFKVKEEMATANGDVDEAKKWY